MTDHEIEEPTNEEMRVMSRRSALRLLSGEGLALVAGCTAESSSATSDAAVSPPRRVRLTPHHPPPLAAPEVASSSLRRPKGPSRSIYPATRPSFAPTSPRAGPGLR